MAPPARNKTGTAPPAKADTGIPDGAADDLNNRIFFRLFQLANTLQRQAVKELGITTVQWAVLGALSDPRPTQGMSVGALADFLVVSRQNLDGVLKRLERDGLVERVGTGGRGRSCSRTRALHSGPACAHGFSSSTNRPQAALGSTIAALSPII